MEAIDHLYNMCAIGKRNAGFGGDIAAAAYIEKFFYSIGLKNVQRQSFLCRAWDFTDCKLFMGKGGVKKEIRALPCYYSPSTPIEGLHKSFLYVDSPEALKSVGQEAEDKIILLYMELIGSVPLFETLKSHRPAAVVSICTGNDPFVGLMDKYIVMNCPGLPMASISYSDAETIVLENPDILHLYIEAKYKERAHSENVTARIETSGAEKNIMLGAHYDTIPLPHCATDNTAGISVIMDTAEKLTTRTLNKYNVEFVSFSAEEIDRQGALDYIDKNTATINNTVLMIYIDGCGPYIGQNNLQIIGEARVAEVCMEAADSIGFPLAIDNRTIMYWDHAYIASMGTPSGYLSRGPLKNWHTRNDTPDKLSARQMGLMSDYLTELVLTLDRTDAYDNLEIDKTVTEEINKAIRSFEVKVK